MTFNYHRYGSYVGSNTSIGAQSQKGVHNLPSAKLTRPSFEGFVANNKDAHTFTIRGGTYKIFLMGAGGGGGYNYSSRYGGNGGFFSFVATLPAGEYECGVGEGGKYTNANAVNPPNNTAGYAMRAGQGSYGDGTGSGSGGGGSYLKANFTLPATVPNWANYIAIAGGGDSAADWAIELSKNAKKIYFIHRRTKLRAAPNSLKKLYY